MKKIKINLTSEEAAFLSRFRQEKGRTLRQTNRAAILLLCHRGKRETDIADFLGIDSATIWRIKKRFAAGGMKRALEENPRPGQPERYGTDPQTGLSAIACSKAPEGRERWTLELLTEKMRSEVAGCETISKETVRLMLKKTGLSPG